MELKDFQGRINQEMFTNIEKSYDTKSFNETFPANKFKVIEAPAVQKFIDTIKKGVESLALNDKEAANNLLQKSIADVKRLRKVNLIDDISQRDVFVLEIVEKAKTEATGEEGEEIEKGVVSDAFTYQSNIKFTKTGKEMKEKMAASITALEATAKTFLKSLEDASDKLEYQPTEKIDTWRLRQFKHIITSPYKVFNWNQTYYYEKEAMNSSATAVIAESGHSCSPACSKEEADLCNAWNTLVYKYIDTLYEIELLKMYKDNLEDKKSYELTSEQLVALSL